MEGKKIAVYKLYALGRLNTVAFDPEVKKLERDLHAVSIEYAENINSFSKINGLHYELDKKATEAYWSGKPYKKEVDYTDFDVVVDVDNDEDLRKIKLLTGNDLSVAVRRMDNKDKIKMIDELKEEYKKTTGKKPGDLWGIVKLLDELKLYN